MTSLVWPLVVVARREDGTRLPLQPVVGRVTCYVSRGRPVPCLDAEGSQEPAVRLIIGRHRIH